MDGKPYSTLLYSTLLSISYNISGRTVFAGHAAGRNVRPPTVVHAVVLWWRDWKELSLIELVELAHSHA